VFSSCSFSSHTEQLLLLLAGDAAEAECVGMLFEFLHSLVTLQVPGLNRLYPHIVTVAMQWIRTELACTQSLSLIYSIAEDLRRSDGDAGTVEVRQNVTAQLNESLSVSSE
jgi:hypothetical protein